MNSYNKNYLDDLSRQLGFIRDNLEKVMRLTNILRYIHEVITYLHELLHFSESELAFIENFKQREYHPELLFDDADMIARISQHPMALWKCRQKV